MRYYVLLVSTVWLLSACQLPPAVAPDVSADQTHTNLLSTSSQQHTAELGKHSSIYEIPVMIATPHDAILKVEFKIKSAGHCISTYEPTVFYFNQQLLETIDFRQYFLKSTIKRDIAIDQSLMKQGRNLLRIETGQCQYDIDVMALNQLELIRREQ